MRVATKDELNKVRKLLTDDKVDLAILELRKLYNRYPDDTVVVYELGTTLLRQGKNVQEALFLLKLATNSNNKDAITNDIGIYFLNHGEFDKAEERFLQLTHSNEKAKCYGYTGLIRVYIHTENYGEALHCFNTLNDIRIYLGTEFKVSHFYNMKFYLLYKNGLLSENSHIDNYFRKQLVDYNRERTIEHMKEHLKEKEEINDDPHRDKMVHSVFDKEVDLEKLYDYCVEYIKDRKPDNYGFVDYYKCKLDKEIGATYSSQATTYVEIVVTPNTKDILSIYPVNNEHINKVTDERTKERKQPKKKKYNKNYKKNR